MKEYFSKSEYIAKQNTILDKFSIDEFIKDKTISSAWINVGGWQSWNPGFEVMPGKKQDSLKNLAIKNWNKWLVFPNTKYKPSKNIVLGQFISYLRWNDTYLLFVSYGNKNNTLPPVQFIFNRNENTVTIEINDKSKNWKNNELQAQIEIFKAESFSEAKNKISELFGTLPAKKIVGWESWYNHYEKINEELILKDLNEIENTNNLMKVISDSKSYHDDYSERIFQIDDGWQISLGDWDCNKQLFPSGLKSITEKIEEKKFVPGLWIAPLIIDLRSNFAVQHPEWLLRDNKGNLVKAGWNPRWGSNGVYYCLDLSNQSVQEHLSSLMNKAINEWGFRYLKLDFLFAGMLDGFHEQGGAAYEYYTKALKILTDIKYTNDGKPVYYLGCGIPLEMGFKYFPLSRIGCDTYEHWENNLMTKIKWNGRASAYLNLKDTLGKALWNGSVFACDPDVIFIRKDNCSLTNEEKKIIAFIDCAFGSQIMYSDDPSTCTTDDEKKLTLEIAELIEKYKNQKFSVKNLDKDLYEMESQNCKATISIGNEHFIRFENK